MARISSSSTVSGSEICTGVLEHLVHRYWKWHTLKGFSAISNLNRWHRTVYFLTSTYQELHRRENFKKTQEGIPQHFFVNTVHDIKNGKLAAFSVLNSFEENKSIHIDKGTIDLCWAHY